MKMSWSLEFRLIMLRCNLKTSKFLIVLTKNLTASAIEKKYISDHYTFHCLSGLMFYSEGYL